jgi:hypothetical protein
VSAPVQLDLTCPQCHEVDAIDLSDGTWLCLGCRHEWRPGARQAVAQPQEAAQAPVGDSWGELDRVLHAPTVGDVLEHVPGAAQEGADVYDLNGYRKAVPADWSGSFVRAESGRVLVITADDGTDTLEGVDSTGNTWTVFRSACDFLGDEPDAGDLVAESTDEADAAVMVPTIMAVAGLCITVALDCVPDDDEAPLGAPRVGWLPPPCDQVPEAEAGVAWAVALLVRTFGLDKAEVARLAANLITGAESATNTGDNT